MIGIDAIKIQAVWRGYLIRKQGLLQVLKEHQIKLIQAAIMIQKTWKGN